LHDAAYAWRGIIGENKISWRGALWRLPYLWRGSVRAKQTYGDAHCAPRGGALRLAASYSARISVIFARVSAWRHRRAGGDAHAALRTWLRRS